MIFTDATATSIPTETRRKHPTGAAESRRIDFKSFSAILGDFGDLGGRNAFS
jgi:hypothetical protein